MPNIHRTLASNTAVTLSQESGRDQFPICTAIEERSNKTADILDHPSTHHHQLTIFLESSFNEPKKNRPDPFVGFLLFRSRHTDLPSRSGEFSKVGRIKPRQSVIHQIESPGAVLCLLESFFQIRNRMNRI